MLLGLILFILVIKLIVLHFSQSTTCSFFYSGMEMDYEIVVDISSNAIDIIYFFRNINVKVGWRLFHIPDRFNVRFVVGW